MCTDIIANSNITKVFVVNPCDSRNTDVNTPLNAIHVHVTQYSSLSPLKTIYKDFHHFHFQFSAYWISANINM